MCSLVYQYCYELGLTNKFSLINNGDDCVVFMEREHEREFVRGLDEWFRAMGFNMKVEPTVDILERVEFCQTRPVFDGQRYIMVRNPEICLSKDLVFIKPLDHANPYMMWIGAVGDCGLSMSGGIPILQEFYQAMRRSCGDHKRIKNDLLFEGGLSYMSIGMNRKYTKVSPQTRFSFYLAFGVLPEYQIALENTLRGVSFKWSQPKQVSEMRSDITWLGDD
jgi:hypothetical protein